METFKTEIVVLGGGPGGYAAAHYASDKGKKVILVDMEPRLGGVCLNRGCIPSKALLHIAHLIAEAKESAHKGIVFGEPKIELDKLRAWKNKMIDQLSAGIKSVGKAKGVEVLQGRGYFEDSKTLRVETSEGQKFVKFDQAIIAVGSKPALPAAFDLGNPRVMTSTEALDLEEIPEKLLIIGGGYIGMELGTVYSTFGSEITMVEAMGSLLMGADTDLARPVVKYAKENFKEVRLNTKVLKMATSGRHIKVISETEGVQKEELFDKVLVSIGRTPNSFNLGLENTIIQKDEKSFIKVNDQQQTNDPAIYAIGDVAGGLLLAHKASKEARIAVDAITGESHASHADLLIPAVVYTDPEIAWCGLTESEAKAKNIQVKVSKFPWSASGRAMSLGRTEGLTKLIIEPETDRILGVGITGVGAGDLISEGMLAVAMGATALDLAETIHPHPTLSETLMECAESFYGVSAHAISPKRKVEE